MPRLRRNSTYTQVIVRSDAKDSTDEARIGALIEPQPDGCWLFKGKLDKYGRAYITKGRSVAVHRYVYETLVAPLTNKQQLHHHCLTPGCCNPDHIVPLTAGQHAAEHALLNMPEPTTFDERVHAIRMMDKARGIVG